MEEDWQIMLRRENERQARAIRLRMFASRLAYALIIGGIAAAIAMAL